MGLAWGKRIQKTLKKMMMGGSILTKGIFDQRRRSSHVETEVEDL